MIEKLTFKPANEIYSKITDGTHDSPKQKEKGKPLITSKHIKSRNIDFDTAYLISEEDFENINKRSQVDKWDVIVSMIGEYCGYCYIERNNHIEYAIKNVGLYKTETKLDAEWLFYYLNSSIGKAFLNSVKSGSSQPYLTLGGLRELPILMASSIDQQKGITKVLSDLDAKIEVNNKINQELEAMAKLIYDYWFVQFDFPMPKEYATSIGKPELAGKPYKASGGKMVFNKELKREIPEGWEDGVIADLIKNDKSGDWGKDEVQGNYTVEVSCIRGADINGINGQGEVKAPKRFILEKNTHKILEPFDLVVEISGGSPTQSTGRLTYVTEATQERFDNPLICSNFCKALTLKESKSLFNFVFEWNRLYDAGVLFGWEGKTSGIKNLLFDNFVTNHKIPLVPIELMNQFFDKVYSVHQKIQKNLLENQKLAELRDWLLPMLMNGQVRVAHSLEEGNPKEAYDEIEDMVSGPDSYREAAEDGGKYGEG